MSAWNVWGVLKDVEKGLDSVLGIPEGAPSLADGDPLMAPQEAASPSPAAAAKVTVSAKGSVTPNASRVSQAPPLSPKSATPHPQAPHHQRLPKATTATAKPAAKPNSSGSEPDWGALLNAPATAPSTPVQHVVRPGASPAVSPQPHPATPVTGEGVGQPQQQQQRRRTSDSGDSGGSGGDGGDGGADEAPESQAMATLVEDDEVQREAVVPPQTPQGHPEDGGGAASPTSSPRSNGVVDSAAMDANVDDDAIGDVARDGDDHGDDEADGDEADGDADHVDTVRTAPATATPTHDTPTAASPSSPSSPCSCDALQSEVDRLRAELAAREQQLLQASQSNGRLVERVESLEAAAAAAGSTDALMEEFSQRLAREEAKLSRALKEKSALAAEVEKLRQGDPSKELREAKEGAERATEAAVAEAKALRAEGMALAEKLATAEGRVRQLRATVKQNDAAVANLRDSLATAEAALGAKTTELSQALASQSRYDETVSSMRQVSDSASKQLAAKQRVEESLRLRIAELEKGLEKAWVDIASQKKQQAIVAEQHAIELTDVREQVESELGARYEAQIKEWRSREHTLKESVFELRASLSRVNERAQWREDELNKSIARLQERIADMQGSEQQVQDSVDAATQPLLRQIDHMQKAQARKEEVWAQVEQQLLTRVEGEEASVVEAQAKARELSGQMQKIRSKLRALESQLSQAHKERAEALADHEVALSRVSEVQGLLTDAQDEARTERQEHERLRQAHSQTMARVSALSGEVDQLKAQLAKARMARVTDMQASKPGGDKGMGSGNGLGSGHGSDVGGGSGGVGSGSVGGGGGGGASFNSSRVSSVFTSLLAAHGAEALRPGSVVHERIQSMMETKEQQVTALQQQVMEAQQQRKQLEDELVAMAQTNDKLLNDSHAYMKLKSEYELLSKRHTTALELLGEKEERLWELQADLNDLKHLYKTQITELCGRLEAQKAQLRAQSLPNTDKQPV